MNFCSKIGSMVIRNAVSAIRSVTVGMPRGLSSVLPSFGIHVRRIGLGSYVSSSICWASLASRVSTRRPKSSIVSRSTPALPRFRLTRFHAAASVSWAYTLSISEYHLPPFTPLSRASSMRSVQTLGSVHSHRASTSLPRLAIGTSESCSSVRPFLTHHLPVSLGSTPVTALHRYYGDSDSLPPPPLLRQGLPDSRARASNRSAPQTPDVSRDRFPHAPQRHGLSFRTVSRLRPPGLGFAIGLQARQHIRPNRVPLVRTGRSPSVAPHPVSPRRSYGRLWSMSV